MVKKECVRHIALAAIFLCAAPAFAKKPLNFRRRSRPPAPAAAKTAVTEVVKSSTSASDGALTPGRWDPKVREEIEKLIASKGRTSGTYNPKVPPVAVLPWSDAAVVGDPAELVFLRLVSDVDFRFDDSFWEIVPIGYGRQPAHAAYEQFVTLSTTVWASQPGYHAWRKTMLSSYISLCRGVGRKECRSYLGRLWTGWRAEQAVDFAKRVLDEEKRHPEASEAIPGEPGDPAPLRVRRGLREIPEMRELVVGLRRAGFDVWVIDDVPQPVLEASAAAYGVDASRVFGVRNTIDGVRLGAGVLKPVPTRGGKTEALQSSLGRSADLVIGRDSADADVLSYGSGLRVVFDGDTVLVNKAAENGWFVQRAFAR